MTRDLTDFERDEIRRLTRNPRGGSDRDRNAARTVLKKRGLIEFDRKAWRWFVLPAGRAILAEAREEGDANA